MNLQIKHERIAHGWTQQSVANKLGVSKQTIHDIETGRRRPSYELLLAIEDLFQKTHRQLMYECKEEKPV